MLQEPSDKLLGTYSRRLVRARTAGAISERNNSGAVDAWFHLNDSAVADRNAEYVRSQIPKCQPAIADRFAVDIPSLLPDFRWDLCQ